MAHTAILERIRLLLPAKLDGHYESIRRGFEEGDLTAPSLSISEMELARAISEFIADQLQRSPELILKRDRLGLSIRRAKAK
jgi:hypothetical protein